MAGSVKTWEMKMKTGRTINELAAELTRQAASKKDFIARTNNMLVVVDDRKPKLALGDKHEFAINEIAHDQIGAHTGIPAKYYDRMRTEAPQLLANNINEWFRKYPAPRLVRTLDETTRALLSNQYRPLENYDLANAVLPIIADLKLEVMSCEVTERRLYIKAVDQRILRDVPKGRTLGDGSHVGFDTCSPAVIISNSEVGYGNLSVESGVFTHACTNLMAFAKAGMKRRHVGARHELTDVEQIEQFLSDATREATDRAIWMQVRDIVLGSFNEAKFSGEIDKLKELAGIKLEGNPVEVIELTTKKFGFTESEKGSLMTHLIEGGDLSRYGLLNAVTRTAQDLDSYDRASEFERIGGQIIELPSSGWKELAVAA
jgi:hypothetical protein